MEPLELLRAKIAGFPGYDGEHERRLSDEYVRAYLGEALADLEARHVLPDDLQQRLDDLLLRIEFADSGAFAGHHIEASNDGASDGGAVAAADAATVELADRAAAVDSQSAPRYFDDVTAILNQRDAAIRAAMLKLSR